MIGRVVGNFQILELLGQGGIGAVYAGIDRMLGRPVAIKLLRPELSHDTRFVDRFRSEAASLARLNHPNITTLYTLHTEGQELMMIIELVEGRTLEDLLQASGRLSPEECLALAAQATEGFAYAHRMGVVHRDIKPANLMVTGDGALKIMDFGIARIRGSQRMTRTGHIIGTLAYMAPEQIQGHEGDERSDIYSLAIVLYELLSGDPPFIADSEYQLIRAQVEEEPRALGERITGLNPAIDAAVMRALAKEPGARFANMTEFSRALGSTMGLTAAKETMVRRVAPLVSQISATRQRAILTDPIESAEVAQPGRGKPGEVPSGGRASGRGGSVQPAWPQPSPSPAPAPLPPSPRPDPVRKRLSMPAMILGGALLLFLVGVGYILSDTFFSAKTPQVVGPGEPSVPKSTDVVTPAPVEPPANAVTSTESPGNQPATNPPPVSPTPTPTSPPVTLAPPGSQPTDQPGALVPPLGAPGKLAPALGSIEPKDTVEEPVDKPAASDKKSTSKPQPKKPTTTTVRRKDDSGGSAGSSRSESPRQTGNSGWIIERN